MKRGTRGKVARGRRRAHPGRCPEYPDAPLPAIEDVRHRIRHGLRQVAGASEVLRTSRSTLLAVAELARRYGGDAPAAGAHHGLGPFELRAFSQNGEDGVIAEILRRCEAFQDGYFV